MPVSAKGARLGKMRSRPNKCSSERPCLRIIACWSRQTSHNPIKRASICHMSAQWTAHLHFRAPGYICALSPDKGPAENCARLREIGLELRKLHSRLRVANCPQNAKTLFGFHFSRICCPNSTTRATPCYAESVGPGSTTHMLQSI